ncbi:MAG: trypsin-like serine protease [Bdellovibrionota bacterium]|nr:MAG: trypsin-like serine protease [Bdellovibrionota bacterium]
MNMMNDTSGWSGRFLRALTLSVALIALGLASGCGGGGGDDELSQNSCSLLGLSTRIINGSACAESQAPVVRLSLISRNATALCSGTVISPTKVLTAAHCFLGPAISRVDVLVEGQTISATQAFIHPGVAVEPRTKAVLNDVAVVELARPTTIAPVALYTSSSVGPGDVFSVFGYGLDERGFAGTLRSGEMRVEDLTENHIFARYEGEGSNTCNGDSGGPALLEIRGQPTLIGLTSSGANPDCGPGDLSLFQYIQNEGVLEFLRQVAPEIQER